MKSQNNNMANQLDYSKYFPFNFGYLVVVAIVLTVAVGIISAILIRTGRLTKKKKVILLIISIVCGGFIFGGFPNVIFLTGLTFLLLGLTLIFGRIFCGYVCPLGALQELASMVRFKTDLDLSKEPKKNKTTIRWLFFVIFVIIILTFGFNITQFLNPLNGYRIIWQPFNLLIIVALILLSIVLISSFFIYRPFCRYLCPFGALAAVCSKYCLLKIRRSDSCQDCGLCEKICPTSKASRTSNKGECYLCNRCNDFCSDVMLVDSNRIAQINRIISVITLSADKIQREDLSEKLMKSIILIFPPIIRMQRFKELTRALEGKKEFHLAFIQKIIVRMNELFADELKSIEKKSLKDWIKKSSSNSEVEKNSYFMERICYC